MTRGGALRAISCLAAPLLQSLFFFFFFLHTYRRKMTRGGALRAISRLAAPLLQSCTKVHSFAYSPQNTTLPRTASTDGKGRGVCGDTASTDGNGRGVCGATASTDGNGRFLSAVNNRLVTSSVPVRLRCTTPRQAKHVLYRRENTHPPLERRGTERTDSRGEEEVQPTSVRGVMHGRDARKQPRVTYFTTYIITVPSVHSVHPRSGACCFLTLNKRGSATHAR